MEYSVKHKLFQEFEQQQKEVIVTNYDKDWDYKKVGNEYFAKRKNSNNWIKVTGKSLEAIKANVFKEKQQDYSQLQPISKSNSQIDGNLADQPRSDRTGSGRGSRRRRSERG